MRPPQAGGAVRFLQTRTGYFDELIILAVRGDRIVAAQKYVPDAIRAGLTDVSFSVRLPPVDKGSVPAASEDPERANQASRAEEGDVSYIAVFENAEFPTTLSNARLAAQPIDAQPATVTKLFLIAVMIGFLLLPVILDLAFFQVFRTQFLLWHAVLALAMAWHLSTSGALAALVPISTHALNHQAILSFGAVIACAVMFAVNFIEKDKQSPLLRRMLIGWVFVILVITALRMARFDALGPISAKLYFAAFMPLLALIFVFIADAIQRKSRAVWFQLIAWLPFFALGLLRLSTMLGTDASYVEAVWLFRIGAVTEVTVTALGIVDRVIQIRRERDDALIEAHTLELLSTRDPLTGLLNRRGLETRLDDLLAQGFDTVALFDLDRFKQVNDQFGHQVGDAALVACAQALRGNHGPDLVAARLGGEEFIVILRGERTLERAEAIRKAIPVRVAADVEGLGLPVTASSGAIEVPRGANALMNFDTLYARADALMYEAKASGRNRMLYERLTVFQDAPAGRPQTERRTGDGRREGGAESRSKVA